MTAISGVSRACSYKASYTHQQTHSRIPDCQPGLQEGLSMSLTTAVFCTKILREEGCAMHDIGAILW